MILEDPEANCCHVKPQRNCLLDVINSYDVNIPRIACMDQKSIRADTRSKH